MIREIAIAIGVILGLVTFAVGFAWLGARLIRADIAHKRRQADAREAGEHSPRK